MKHIISFIKNETVLTVAFLLAVISAFVIVPDRERQMLLILVFLPFFFSIDDYK